MIKYVAACIGRVCYALALGLIMAVPWTAPSTPSFTTVCAVGALILAALRPWGRA